VDGSSFLFSLEDVFIASKCWLADLSLFFFLPFPSAASHRLLRARRAGGARVHVSFSPPFVSFFFPTGRPHAVQVKRAGAFAGFLPSLFSSFPFFFFFVRRGSGREDRIRWRGDSEAKSFLLSPLSFFFLRALTRPRLSGHRGTTLSEARASLSPLSFLFFFF